MNRERGGNWLFALAALAAGVGLGLLFAPRAGFRTRDRLAFKLRRLRHVHVTSAHHNGKSLKGRQA